MLGLPPSFPPPPRRLTKSLDGIKYPIWGYIFFGAEVLLIVGLLVSHVSRAFPIHRERVTMDELVDSDPQTGDLKVAILLPTAGEKLQVMLQALFGVLQLRLWSSSRARCDTLRVIILDEKRRWQVQQLASLVYTLAEVVLDKGVRDILRREEVPASTARAFYELFSDGLRRHTMNTDNLMFVRGVAIVDEIDKLLHDSDGSVHRLDGTATTSLAPPPTTTTMQRAPTTTTVRARRASCFVQNTISPGFTKTWAKNARLPTLVYHSRTDAGMPRVSPKAGNMNCAIFRKDGKGETLIAGAAVIVVNDARHALQPEFLQRALPYFFTRDARRAGAYVWADVAFVQTPQRFDDVPQWADPDPLGNQAATQFDIVNPGRDGASGVLSCGQGSLWRVAALRDGIRPDGSKYIDTKADREGLIGRTGGLGFRSEVLIEDTHTSLDLLRQGWRSVYVVSPASSKGEVLARCTLPPDSVTWRVKQVLRWHQGAVQLALSHGFAYVFGSGHWASPWQRVFALDAITYVLQAFAGQILLVFPIVYGFTNQSPFNALNLQFATYFFPFLITAALPTMAALGWLKTSSDRVMRDEQVWFATTYVQLQAVCNVIWCKLLRRDPADAWTATCPVWPLYAQFLAIAAAMVANTGYWIQRGFTSPWVWVSCMGAGLFALHSLWPLVSFGLGVTLPPAYYNRVFGMLILMTLVAFWML
ncbi:cellulose synthase, family GT2 [Tribonema minus]|uniref:Cellulose synthase, family GT2 n=1 Tax=Tribonema minus TaxID=303371 RepID=A0A835YIK8_9STRA|nr:cellulose synthase, family GT2 [Tribonema minus]